MRDYLSKGDKFLCRGRPVLPRGIIQDLMQQETSPLTLHVCRPMRGGGKIHKSVCPGCGQSKVCKSIPPEAMTTILKLNVHPSDRVCDACVSKMNTCTKKILAIAGQWTPRDASALECKSEVLSSNLDPAVETIAPISVATRLNSLVADVGLDVLQQLMYQLPARDLPLPPGSSTAKVHPKVLHSCYYTHIGRATIPQYTEGDRD